jgi:RhoGAP domain/SH2 domain
MQAYVDALRALVAANARRIAQAESQAAPGGGTAAAQPKQPPAARPKAQPAPKISGFPGRPKRGGVGLVVVAGGGGGPKAKAQPAPKIAGFGRGGNVPKRGFGGAPKKAGVPDLRGRATDQQLTVPETRRGRSVSPARTDTVFEFDLNDEEADGPPASIAVSAGRGGGRVPAGAGRSQEEPGAAGRGAVAGRAFRGGRGGFVGAAAAAAGPGRQGPIPKRGFAPPSADGVPKRFPPGSAVARESPLRDSITIESRSWFFGNMPRDVAEKALASVGSGFFLVRRSSSAGAPSGPPSYALSCSTVEGNMHSLVRFDGTAWNVDGTDSRARSAVKCVIDACQRQSFHPLNRWDARIESLTLHPEWRSVLSPDGKKYYYSRVTKATSWKPVYRVDYSSAPAVAPPKEKGLRVSDRAVLVSRSRPNMIEVKVVVSREPFTSYVVNVDKGQALVRDGIMALATELQIAPATAPAWVDSHELVVVDLTAPDDSAILMHPARPLLSYPLTGAHEVELRRAHTLPRQILVTVSVPALALSSVLPVLAAERVTEVVERFATMQGADPDQLLAQFSVDKQSGATAPVRLVPTSTLHENRVADGDILIFTPAVAVAVVAAASPPSPGPQRLFGVDPDSLPTREIAPYGHSIPEVLATLQDTVMRGLATPGIFRFATAADVLDKGRQALEQGQPLGDSEDDVRTAAWLVRSWFFEMPARLLSGVPVETLMNAVDPATGSSVQCTGIVQSLPPTFQHLFSWLIGLLSAVAAQQAGEEASLAQAVAPALAGSQGQSPFEAMHLTGVVGTFVFVMLEGSNAG